MWETRLDVTPKRVNGQDPESVGLGCEERVNKHMWETCLDFNPHSKSYKEEETN